jgi:dUTP pyrophosphatase
MSYYLLKLFIDSKDNELLNLYTDFSRKHNSVVMDGGLFDAGIDLFCPEKLIMSGRQTGKVDHCVKAAMEFIDNIDKDSGIPVGYYLYPRSSTGTKTPLRLSNSIGIIDSGYRGHIIAVFDNWQDVNFTIEPYQRLVQLCPPNLTYPIYVRLVEKEEDLGVTVRGGGGFGSTGK